MAKSKLAELDVKDMSPKEVATKLKKILVPLVSKDESEEESSIVELNFEAYLLGRHKHGDRRFERLAGDAD